MYDNFKTSTNTMKEKIYKDAIITLPKKTHLISKTREKYNDTSTLASFSDELFDSTCTSNL